MKIKVELIVELDDNLWGWGKSETQWFKDRIMVADQIYLHSNEIGDELGVVKEIVSWNFIDEK